LIRVRWQGIGFTPGGMFFGDADRRAALAIVRGSGRLPMDGFVALNRRESLADALARRPRRRNDTIRAASLHD